MINRLICAGIAICTTIFAATVDISTEGKANFVIVLPETPTAVEKTAARELTEHLKQITGAEFKVIPENELPEGRTALLLGQTKASAGAFDDPAFTNAKPDHTAIKFQEGNVYLSGKAPTGPLYAVYIFLEDYCGVRWWTPDERFIPDKPTLSVDAKDFSYAPALRFREPYYLDAVPCEQAARCKTNGDGSKLTPEYGGKKSIIGFVHTFFKFLPPDKYYNEHPEWYSLVGGKRIKDYVGQLCLSNEEMRAEFVRVCLEMIRKNPDAGIISVSQNDTHGPCECEKCKAIVQEEGSQAGPLLRFVNAVAAEIAKEYPDFLVETLAYEYTMEPPQKTKPADNVIIRLCSMGMDFSQSLETGPRNATFSKAIDGWGRISKNLFIWNYVANFSNCLVPHPNYKHIGDDIRFFVKNHAIGLFEQGDNYCNVGDFVRPRAWIISKLMWNPDLDEHALVKEFYDGYYGEAGKYLLEYQDFLVGKVEAKNYKLVCMIPTTPWLELEDIMEAYKIYAKAEEAVASDPILSERVRRERLPLDNAFLSIGALQVNASRFKNVKFDVDKDKLIAIGREFEELTDKYSPAKRSEGGVFGDYAKRLNASIRKVTQKREGPVPAICKDIEPQTWDCFKINEFSIHPLHMGNLVDIVDDPNAEGGKAAAMPNTHFMWVTQCSFGSIYKLVAPKWHIRVRVRCDAESKDGNALKFGVYDLENRKTLHEEDVAVAKVAGKDYVTLETPALEISNQFYVFVAPVKRPENEVSKVYTESAAIFMEQE